MPKYKYGEESILSELKSYIDKTYDGHYVSGDAIQAIDAIFSAGHGVGFCVGDIIKYASRYGKKAGEARKDIFKILHYAMFLLYLHDKAEHEREEHSRYDHADDAIWLTTGVGTPEISQKPVCASPQRIVPRFVDGDLQLKTQDILTRKSPYVPSEIGEYPDQKPAWQHVRKA